ERAPADCQIDTLDPTSRCWKAIGQPPHFKAVEMVGGQPRDKRHLGQRTVEMDWIWRDERAGRCARQQRIHTIERDARLLVARYQTSDPAGKGRNRAQVTREEGK